MNPLFLVVAPMVLLGNRNRTRKQRKKDASQQDAGGVGKRPRPRPRPAYAKRGNGKIKQQWTSFPWQPDRVTEVASELLEKGEKDADKLALAVTKMLYPVHPISGMAFDWPPVMEGPERDVGAQMLWERVRLRVNTLVAGDEERIADEATVMAAQAAAEAEAEAEADAEPESEPEAEPQEDDSDADADADADAEDDAEDDADEKPEPTSPRIGRIAPPPMAEALPTPARRRPLTLTRKRVMRRRQHVDPYALHPEDNRVGDGLYHTVQGSKTIQAIARAALAIHVEPTDEQVAQYVSLIVCSPANNLPTVWDDEHNVPGAAPFPWGAERPTIWLPKLNEAKLQGGIITTLGVTWPDGSNGITPPPEQIPRD